jgi:hypothetical protein
VIFSFIVFAKSAAVDLQQDAKKSSKQVSKERREVPKDPESSDALVMIGTIHGVLAITVY